MGLRSTIETPMIHYTLPALAHPKIPPLSLACRIDNLIFVSGTPGYDDDMQLESSFVAQFTSALRKLEITLAENGGSFETVVKVGIYLTRMDDLAEMNRLYGLAFTPGPYPARTTVIVAGLPDPAMLVELDCVALVRP